MKKKSKTGFVVKLSVALCVLFAIFFGGYFFLDKLIVPKYFSDYGINSISDLVSVVSSLYSTPKESELVTNGYTQMDLKNAISELQENGYKIEDDGTILKTNMSDFKGTGQVELTDRQFAAVCNKLIESGILVDSLPDLNYLNILNISVLELIISPDENSLDEDTQTYSKASIQFIIKIETEDIRKQISETMNTPMYLLKIIIPDTLYFTLNYDIDLEADGEERTTGTIAINGKSEKQSKVLINLLIDFIFPEEDNMDMESFTRALGNVALSGIDALGEFKFINNASGSTNAGILVN